MVFVMLTMEFAAHYPCLCVTIQSMSLRVSSPTTQLHLYLLRVFPNGNIPKDFCMKMTQRYNHHHTKKQNGLPGTATNHHCMGMLHQCSHNTTSCHKQCAVTQLVWKWVSTWTWRHATVLTTRRGGAICSASGYFDTNSSTAMYRDLPGRK